MSTISAFHNKGERLSGYLPDLAETKPLDPPRLNRAINPRHMQNARELLDLDLAFEEADAFYEDGRIVITKGLHGVILTDASIHGPQYESLAKSLHENYASTAVSVGELEHDPIKGIAGFIYEARGRN